MAANGENAVEADYINWITGLTPYHGSYFIKILHYTNSKPKEIMQMAVSSFVLGSQYLHTLTYTAQPKCNQLLFSMHNLKTVAPQQKKPPEAEQEMANSQSYPVFLEPLKIKWVPEKISFVGSSKRHCGRRC